MRAGNAVTPDALGWKAMDRPAEGPSGSARDA